MAELDHLFRLMIVQKGSDLHLSSFRRPMLRVHGDMHPIESLPTLNDREVRELIWEITPEANRQQYEQIHDTDFAYEVPGLARVRVNVFRDRLGIGAVCRVIPNRIMTAEELGLPQAVRDFCMLSKGFVAVTGPTGSGKSTTLAAMVDLINRTRREHVITIEDPIEFVHTEHKCLINQREVHAHTSSFAQALRAALREDPDVVLVGELRDIETIEIAMETAQTGHLVFGTLHTNTAHGTVDRIIDVFPSERQNQVRTMLAGSLKGAVCQTLCRRKGGGRVAALEILIVDQAVSALIREGKTHQIPSAMQLARSRGMITLNESLTELVRQELVEPADAYVKAVDRDDLLNRYKKAGVSFTPAME